jgi:hypothetical protein
MRIITAAVLAGSLAIASAPALTAPIHNGKAPSCNVQIQNMGATLRDFRTQSLGQLKALGITLESETSRKVSGKQALLFASSGHALSILSLAVQSGRFTS